MVTTGKNETNQLLRAVIALLVHEYESNPINNGQKIELLLAASGLGYQEIASILGKKPDAVRMLLKRNKQAQKNI